MTTPRRRHVDIPDTSRYSRRDFLAGTGATGAAIIAPAFVPLKVRAAADPATDAKPLPAPNREGGMPLYKYLANRALTLIQNLLCGAKLSEYHTGFRAYSRRLLEAIPFERNAEDFVFDNQVIAQALYFQYPVGEISCPTRYFPEASSIDLWRSVRYGIGVLYTTGCLVLQRLGLVHLAIFQFPQNR